MLSCLGGNSWKTRGGDNKVNLGGGAAVMTEQEEGSDGEKLQAVSQQGNAMRIYIFVNTFSSSILLLMSTKLVP